MRKIVCYLLTAWLAVFSSGANAHTTQDAAHRATPTHDHAWHGVKYERESATGIATSAAALDASHTDVCDLTHCGSGHTAGLLEVQKAFVKVLVATCAPTSHAQWASSTILPTIERPKWPFTTPAVVSLLS